MGASTYTYRNMALGVRCHWVYDELYETRGSYAYDTEEETKAAEDEELRNLADFTWVVLGCIVETRCAACDAWSEKDSLWGIVIEPNAEKLDAYARESMDLAPQPTIIPVAI